MAGILSSETSSGKGLGASVTLVKVPCLSGGCQSQQTTSPYQAPSARHPESYCGGDSLEG